MKLDLDIKLNSNYMLLVKLSEFSWRLLMTRISIFLHTTIDNVFTQQVIQNNSVLIIRWMQFVNQYIGHHWSHVCQKSLIFFILLFWLALPFQNLLPSAPQCGEVIFGQAVHSHQVNVSVLLPLELLSTHVTRAVHVQFHVSIKLKKGWFVRITMYYVFVLFYMW